MGRSGYTDDCEHIGLWRAAVSRAISGKRGQAFLHEMAAALDAMPTKELIAEDVVRDDTHVCALGSVALARGFRRGARARMRDRLRERRVRRAVGQGRNFAATSSPSWTSSVDTSKEGNHVRLPPETPAQRWTRMRAWVADQLSPPRKDPPT